MLQLYLIISIDGTFMPQITYPDFTSCISSSGSQFPGLMQVHAILINGINEYPVDLIAELGVVSKIQAVSLLCMCPTSTPSVISNFLDEITPSSSYLYHPKLD